MAENKTKLLKKYERMIGKQEEISEDKFEEIETKLSEDIHEASEGLEIEEEEETGEEAYPEIEHELKRNDEENEDED